MANVHREITPISSQDCFLVFDRVKEDFEFPIHFHPEYEINFIINCKGLKRFVGDSVEELEEPIELVLVGSNIIHGWKLHNCTNKDIHEVTIQFHNDLFHNTFLSRRIMKPIRDMFERASQGIVFSTETAEQLKPRFLKISRLNGIDYFIELLSLLNDLATSRNQRLLSSNSINSNNDDFYNSEKIKLVYEYIRDNFETKIKVKDVAQMVNMTEVSFSRFIKKRTGKTFVEYLNDLRIGYASRWLIEKELSISEIAYKSGFNNLANFNRNFKNSRGCTPTEYRKNFEGIKRVL
ncbi:AraC family transcriptional regulator [Urechidicola croceus]|uniref:AraC family transcriptional regulator n=1 Tax=Urechidicola croceus TaxID=1850246 RepID=A0A1D8PC29_9FLAO|nr:AraC family transcriptional regulator [Urechidicola croceus]